ncbi:hypothetical protein LMH87_012037 [Akanthomyces muscarius]|uniref:Uncharacterized protein n=1 Tax=Akanthomyces muscarius TaxID=2231603 RepID=A0A9W8QAZ5_AKAMU|nr:hypothetical protein LMH87_012037 [Akanthomyces muscarius]KAJ4151331.1 hypothetical protein LMH87_012037 [Akanthomyces muscarius]
MNLRGASNTRSYLRVFTSTRKGSSVKLASPWPARAGLMMDALSLIGDQPESFEVGSSDKLAKKRRFCS